MIFPAPLCYPSKRSSHTETEKLPTHLSQIHSMKREAELISNARTRAWLCACWPAAQIDSSLPRLASQVPEQRRSGQIKGGTDGREGSHEYIKRLSTNNTTAAGTGAAYCFLSAAWTAVWFKHMVRPPRWVQSRVCYFKTRKPVTYELKNEASRFFMVSLKFIFNLDLAPMYRRQRIYYSCFVSFSDNIKMYLLYIFLILTVSFWIAFLLHRRSPTSRKHCLGSLFNSLKSLNLFNLSCNDILCTILVYRT